MYPYVKREHKHPTCSEIHTIWKSYLKSLKFLSQTFLPLKDSACAVMKPVKSNQFDWKEVNLIGHDWTLTMFKIYWNASAWQFVLLLHLELTCPWRISRQCAKLMLEAQVVGKEGGLNKLKTTFWLSHCSEFLPFYSPVLTNMRVLIQSESHLGIIIY